MSRYRESTCKLCRREGVKLFLKGARCYTAKCSLEKRKYAPGQHGQNKFRESEYGIQLREKQKVKRSVLMTERQFRKFFKSAEKEEGPTGSNLLVKLECRLDNIIRRIGFSSSIVTARQLVLHRHIKVNGRICNIPSYVVREGDKISVSNKSKNLQVIKSSLEENEGAGLPEWLEMDTSSLTCLIKRKPTREEVTLVGGDVKENLIVELYSK
ncbi:MAG: 30S ribosomal protein S4 [Elusimicrobia bacterium]|nr:30S ribosomal protein S4 [Elusimicrobiota bacterium]